MVRSFVRFARLTVASALTAAALFGCNGNGQGTVNGKITDGNGAQGRALGGAGTLAAAASVSLSTVADDGSLTVVGEADIQADGSYSIASDAVGEAKLVIQALDANGQAVGSVILDQGLESDETTTASPITSETSVEAAVFIQMAADAALAVSDIDTCDLKARIDAATATSVNASANAQAEVQALAQASASAQAAFFASLNTTAQATFDASVQASADLAAQLDANADNAAAAQASYEAYLSALITSYEGAGFDANEQADAQVTASISFQLSLQAQAQASAEVITSASLMAQAYQGFVITVTSQLLLEAAGAADASITAAATAGAQLGDALATASDVNAGVQAYASFESSCSNGNTSVISAAVGFDATGTFNDPLISQSITNAQAQLDTALATASSQNFSATAQAVVAAYAGFNGSLSATLSGALVTSGAALAQANAAAELFVTASASAEALAAIH